MFILILPPPAGKAPQALSRNFGNTNPSQRLAEIRGKIVIVEARIRDLEALLTELILSPDSDLDPIDGQDADHPVTYEVDDPTFGKRTTSDANTVRQALYAARAEEGELRTSEQFWTQMVQANKEAEKDTHDLTKRG